jgi:hypothetical protein
MITVLNVQLRFQIAAERYEMMHILVAQGAPDIGQTALLTQLQIQYQ